MNFIRLRKNNLCVDNVSVSSVVTITGPGSYTGIRLSLTTLKMVASVTGAQLVGLSLFDAYMHLRSPSLDRLTVLSSNSRKGFLNVQVFQSNQEGFQSISSLLQMQYGEFDEFINKFDHAVAWHHIGDCLPDTVTGSVDISDRMKNGKGHHFVNASLHLQELLTFLFNNPSVMDSEKSLLPIYSSSV